MATTKQARYEAICEQLGFDASVKFVTVSRRGGIGFTCGKPEEIQALLRSVRREGMRPSASLIKAVKNS